MRNDKIVDQVTGAEIGLWDGRVTWADDWAGGDGGGEGEGGGVG